MSNQDIIRGRQVVLPLTNQSGSATSNGDIVIIDTANDDSFTISASSNYSGQIGIVQEPISAGSNGRVLVAGYAAKVNTLATTTRGQWLFQSSTSRKAASGNAVAAGAFGYVTKAGSGTGTAAVIFPTVQGAGSGGAALTVRESDGSPSVTNVDTIIVSNGTLTDSGSGDVTINTSGISGTASTLQFIIDGGGATITAGVKGFIEVPYGCTIVGVRLLADQSGSIVIDIWRDTYANYPPVDADSITASAPPTITTATKSQDTTLTGWTTSLSEGNILGFNVDSVTTLQRVTVVLDVTRT